MTGRCTPNSMKQILVYADSLSWGIIPGTRNRFEFHDRWPGVLESELNRFGRDVRVIEDCLNGRRTVLEDPLKPGRNGLVGLEQRIETNSPLALVMILLGTNDFQSVHDFSAGESAQGIRMLVDAIRRAPMEPGMPHPEILLIAPPAIRAAGGPATAQFAGAESKSVGLSDAIERVAEEAGCEFFDSMTVTESSEIDGVHLDRDQHKVLGVALAAKVADILERDSR